MVLWLYTWQERHAATMGPLNLHRERERKRKDPAPIITDEGRAGPPRERIPPRQREQTAGRTADPPPIIQTANGTKAPSASAQQTAPSEQDRRRTTAPREDGRTTSTGGQEDTERSEGPAAPGQLRRKESRRAGQQRQRTRRAAAPAGWRTETSRDPSRG